jgi:hypothetical protein
MSVLNVLTYIIISITVRPIKLAVILVIMSYLNLYNYMYDINCQQTTTCQRFENYWLFRRKKDIIVYVLTYIGILLGDNSYMIYIIRNPILWLGISAYEGRGFVSLFFDRRCSSDYFFCNINKMAALILDNKKKIKETMFIVNNRQLLLDMK